MDSPKNDPFLFGDVNEDDVLNDVGLGNDFDLNQFLNGPSAGPLDLDEVDELVSDLLEKPMVKQQLKIEEFKPKEEVLDQGNIYGKITARVLPAPTQSKPEASIAPFNTKHIVQEERSSPELPGEYENRKWTPKILGKRPRKYNLQPAEVKKDPVYKDKRQKNNDAVRKCREKAKMKQQEKEEFMSGILEENAQLRAENEELNRTLDYLYARCGCGLLEVVPKAPQDYRYAS